MRVLGLGSAGCRIAQKFSSFPEYSTTCIDVENAGYDNFIKILKQQDHESYEKNYTKLGLNFSEDQLLLVLSGAGAISGCVLRLLEELKTNKIKILYIKPAEEDMSSLASAQNRVVSQVLQQYTRSGVIEEFCFVSNEKIEALTPHISLKNYWGSINDTIVNSFHMINVFENTEPLLTTFSSKPDTARISTIGVVKFEDFEEKLFYDLKMPRSRVYYFGVNNSHLEENKSLLHDVRSSVRTKSSKEVNASFSIYSTAYKDTYVYTKHYATMVQEEYLE
tara:strand:- start:19839 stop:20672 length:834 start_codon:yes stop_codon:yes gene_type:complete